jgi:hypothetical protein
MEGGEHMLTTKISMIIKTGLTGLDDFFKIQI